MEPISRRCLLDALIENQFDRKLEPLWSEMLERTVPATRFLKGGPYDGFQGVLLLPKSEAEPGEPALDAIGGALKALAISFEGRRNKRQRFRDAVQRVTETHRHWPTWSRDLILQAYDSKWPEWALESVPTSLYIPLATAIDGARRVLAWKYLLYPIPHTWEYEVEAQFRNGVVREVIVAGKVARFLEEVAFVIEPVRRQHPDPSDRSLRDEIAHEMDHQALAKRLIGQGELADAYEQAAERIFREIDVPRRARAVA